MEMESSSYALSISVLLVLIVYSECFVSSIVRNERQSALQNVGKTGQPVIASDEEYKDMILQQSHIKPVLIFWTAPWW